MAMAKELYRACDRTMPHGLDAIKNAFKSNSCRVRDGYRLLWDVMITSQPAFCPYKRYPEPQWTHSRDVMTHAKRWILFFRFMGETFQGYSSATKQCMLFLRSIQEPALLSQVKSMEISILNENAQGPLKLRGRAPLPPHLCIEAMAETLAQTVQPLENDLEFAPSHSMTTCGNYMFPNNQPIQPYQPPHYGPSLPYNPSMNLHIMQGSTNLVPTSNWTERHRGGSRGGNSGTNRRPTGDNGAKRRSSRKAGDDQKPRILCQACFSPGHEAAICWTLARALLTAKFIRQLVDKDCCIR